MLSGMGTLRVILRRLSATLTGSRRGEDDRNRQFILSVILLGLIVLALILDSSILYDQFREGAAYKGIPFTIFSGLLLIFVALYVLARSGKYVLSSHALIILMFAAIGCTAVSWGPDLPAVLMGFSLLVVVASILINARFGFFISLAASAILLPLGYFEGSGYMAAGEWKSQTLHFNDTVVFGSILMLIALISWLANRQIETSLRRARSSESALLLEKSLLEFKMEKRTEELRREQAERISELSRFAEFGSLAAGMIHDLLSPLTALSLQVEDLRGEGDKFAGDTGENLESAIRATRKIESLVMAIRKQLGRKEERELFSPVDEVLSVFELLRYKARRAGIELTIQEISPKKVFGDPAKFHQIISNLVSNAIDAYGESSGGRREVSVRLDEFHGILRLEVEDWGVGIPPEDLGRIFDPFFTTKDLRHGTGMGLPTAKHVAEKSFGGGIRAESSPGKGTTIIVDLPANGS
jgi:signal transduction histidine kinase